MYRVMTFNLLCAGRKHRKWQKRAPLVYKIIREANPDSFGVQEAHYEWMKKLAKNLPEKWYIKSCVSCRYGHFCPVGNYDNELFCVTDFAPKEPRDLWHVTENEIERKNRSRTLFDCCDHYKEHAEDYFTYSDYYYEVTICK